MEKKALFDILRYWRNTLAGAARVEIDVPKAINLLEADIDYIEGKVNAEQMRELLIFWAEKRLPTLSARYATKFSSKDTLRMPSRLTTSFSKMDAYTFFRYSNTSDGSSPIWCWYGSPPIVKYNCKLSVPLLSL